MLKRYSYFIFCVFISIVLFFLLIKYPNFLFPREAQSAWNNLRVFYFCLFVSISICGTAFFIREKSMILPYFSKLYKFRSLIYQLVRRDFKAKYKRSVLGIIWTVLNPLLTMVVMIIVFSSMFKTEIENFPVYLLSGTLLFNYFSESTTLAMSSIIAASSMLKKVNIPKYIFPMTKIISTLVNLILSFTALIIVIIVTRSTIYWTIILVPVPIIYLFIFSMGIGLILASMAVFFRDIIYLYGILITALTYLTPLFYPVNIMPDIAKIIISFNPMYHFIKYFRNIALYGIMPSIWDNVVCISISIIALFIGLFIFYKKQDQFILYV